MLQYKLINMITTNTENKKQDHNLYYEKNIVKQYKNKNYYQKRINLNSNSEFKENDNIIIIHEKNFNILVGSAKLEKSENLESLETENKKNLDKIQSLQNEKQLLIKEMESIKNENKELTNKYIEALDDNKRLNNKYNSLSTDYNILKVNINNLINNSPNILKNALRDYKDKINQDKQDKNIIKRLLTFNKAIDTDYIEILDAAKSETLKQIDNNLLLE